MEVIVVEEENAADVLPALPGQRHLGFLRGQLVGPDDFDAPLPPDIQSYFEGDSDKP